MARTKGIYKQGNIYWICYAGVDGKVIRESSSSRKFKDAQALLIQRRRAVQEGKQPEVKRIRNFTFSELAQEYFSWAEKQRSFPSKRYIIKSLVEEFGPVQLRRFNTLLLEQYQSEVLVQGKKPSTANRYLATLKHMFTKAADWEMVEEEVAKRVHKLKLLPENNQRLRYLSSEECQALLNACDKHLRPIVFTALNTGMRKGEILGLRWDENVDLKYGFILLHKTKSGKRREIPINESLREVLSRQIRRTDSSFVFYDPSSGKPYKDVKRSFSSACRRAGIKDFRFHDLRHTFASHLVMNGVDITTVSRLLGHASLTMTLRYAHLAPEYLKNAVETLQSVFGGEPKSAGRLNRIANGF